MFRSVATGEAAGTDGAWRQATGGAETRAQAGRGRSRHSTPQSQLHRRWCTFVSFLGNYGFDGVGGFFLDKTKFWVFVHLFVVPLFSHVWQAMMLRGAGLFFCGVTILFIYSPEGRPGISDVFPPVWNTRTVQKEKKSTTQWLLAHPAGGGGESKYKQNEWFTMH